jgi:hypothetical protein
MSLDTSKIATAAQEFMASLEGDEEYNNSEIAEVGIVVHIRIPDEEDGGTRDGTPTFCTNDSRVYQTGLFRWAEGSAEWSGEPGGDIPGPDDQN